MEIQWPLIIFTLFVSLGAGTFGAAGVLAGLKKGASIQLTSVIIAAIAIIIGGIASFMHLQHWDRAFNGFGNLTSGITQELIAIALFMVFAIIYVVLSRRGDIPVWAGWVAALISVAVVIVMASSYNMASRPVWNSPLLWLYYLSNAILLGGLVVSALLGVKKEDAGVPVKISLAGALLTVISLVGYLIYIPSVASKLASMGNYFDPNHPTKAMTDPAAALTGFASGDQALLFWGGAVVVGALIPLAVAFFSNKKQGSALIGLSLVGALCAVAGAICMRAVLYALGFSVFVFY